MQLRLRMRGYITCLGLEATALHVLLPLAEPSNPLRSAGFRSLLSSLSSMLQFIFILLLQTEGTELEEGRCAHISEFPAAGVG